MNEFFVFSVESDKLQFQSIPATATSVLQPAEPVPTNHPYSTRPVSAKSGGLLCQEPSATVRTDAFTTEHDGFIGHYVTDVLSYQGAYTNWIW